jgi:hypothetical protein
MSSTVTGIGPIAGGAGGVPFEQAASSAVASKVVRRGRRIEEGVIMGMLQQEFLRYYIQSRMYVNESISLFGLTLALAQRIMRAQERENGQKNQGRS